MTTETPNSKFFVYKRSNHFDKLLGIIQGEVFDVIPDQLIDELKKREVKTHLEVRRALKSLGKNKYMEHSVEILQKVAVIDPLQLNSETKAKLRSMFDTVSDSFDNFYLKGKVHKRFLNYKYVMHKLLVLLDLNEFVVLVPLLKSDKKLRENDEIWKKICDDLGYGN